MRQLLLIHDNPLLGETLRVILGKEYRISVCHTGKEGVRQAREMVPNAILCDLALPDMRGTDVVKRLQANPSTRSVPLILVTGNRTVDSAIEKHFCVLRKPFTAEQLRIALINAATPHEEATE